MIFSSDVQGGDVTWPGTTKLFVSRNGDVSLWMATVKGPNHNPATEARKTTFRFGEWHAIGVSYGSQGQSILLDGSLVASSPRRTQTFGAAGSQQSPLDIPTIGETVSHFWQHHRYEGGFDGTVAAFRISNKQQDWSLARSVPAANSSTPPTPPMAVPATPEEETAASPAQTATSGANANSAPEPAPAKQTPEDSRREISNHLDRAQALFKAEQYAGAIDECNSALTLDPGNAAASALKTKIEQTRKLLEQ